VDSRFGSIEGVVATVAGYTGGKRAKPTYNLLGDHTETLLVIFDPEKISYESLLAVFVRGHDPFEESGPKQYRSAVFSTDEEHLKRAKDYLAAYGAREGKEVKTAAELVESFTPAEDYHQKYYLRQNQEFYREIRNRYGSEADFLSSTAAARLNGFLGGNADKAEFERDSGRLGLPDWLVGELRRVLSRRLR
jgi:methionine-S-sulfoxide reductase